MKVFYFFSQLVSGDSFGLHSFAYSICFDLKSNMWDKICQKEKEKERGEKREKERTEKRQQQKLMSLTMRGRVSQKETKKLA